MDDPSQNIEKLKDYYDGTKNERVEFNEFKRAQGEDINSWQTRCRDCRQQGGKCEFCDQCTPE